MAGGMQQPAPGASVPAELRATMDDVTDDDVTNMQSQAIEAPLLTARQRAQLCAAPTNLIPPQLLIPAVNLLKRVREVHSL